MIQKHRIRLNNTESVNSVNMDNKVAVELKQTTKPYFFTESIREQIDQYEVFKEERDRCTKYRLITTIKPYCTNILFNPVTEIVKNEETDSPIIVTDEDSEGDVGNLNDGVLNTALGRTKDISRKYMIKNTEYSSENFGYVYHPGYDIFNNHLLRNTRFKIVNNNRNANREIFNTIQDLAREYDGSNIKIRKRTFNEDNDDITVGAAIDMHLYESSDILSITDAINQRLIEDNGWFGFANQSTINAKDKENNKWYDLDFNRVINSKENCDFIDMYPDRTLYSFHPKYNTYRHRPEYNWKTYLTYPYKNFYDHELIKASDSQINGLLIQEAKYITGITGQDTILFKTFIKHNLMGGSTINLYYLNENNTYDVIENVIISDVGDLDKNNDDFYFYTTDTRIISELEVNTKGIIDKKFRYINVVNGYESEYYIRIFRKLPNLLKSKEITEEDIMNKNALDTFINECQTHFDNETYKLGFSNTIYSDNNTQVTFTDSIEIDKLLDNRGRPLTELYLTIVKNNKGNHKWYKDNEADENTEFSHCFSDVNYGFDLFCDGRLDKDQRIEHAKYSDVKLLHSNENEYNESDDLLGYNMKSDDVNKYGWRQWIDTKENDDNLPLIDVENDEYFIGDIVEYNPTVCTEMVLSECQFRFNSYLRDNPNADKYIFEMDEIKHDDYEFSSANGDFLETSEERDNRILFHPEGYYYKAHYPIQLREWGTIQQGSHFDIKIKSATKVNIGNKICTVIKTTLPHKLHISDTLLICCDEQDKIMKTNPAYVFDELTFAIADYMEYNSDTKEYETVITASDICDILNKKYETISFKLRRYNNEIPYYASKTLNKNRYMWRLLNGVGNKDNINLQEYPFANGCFYINQDINFYLKRQDPFNLFGLYYEGGESIVPNDIFGSVLTPSNYEYKEESEATC